MAALTESRTPHDLGANSPQQSSYNVILDHILQYPGTYEIPLRTMYTLNSTPRAQPVPGAKNPHEAPNDAFHFTSSLMSQISSLPTQPCSLPPSFITTFVRKCFNSELTLVDFPQALAALDYLKDLESRRRREASQALARLGIQSNGSGNNADEVTAQYPNLAPWLENLKGKEKKADQLYTQLYIGLRRWILINELSLLPFNKHNCVAMLNTLYPPITTIQPTTLLTAAVLGKQRDGFFRYITSVEKYGPRMLKTLVEQGKLEGDENGWGAVQQSLDKYLLTAKNMIDDCIEVTGVEHFESADEAAKRKGRKVDSGVSFNSNSNSSINTPPSSTTHSANPSLSEKRPHTGSSGDSMDLGRITPAASIDSRNPYKSLSTLEKITREFKRMRVRNKIEADEIVSRPGSCAGTRKDSLGDGSESPVPERKLKEKRSLRRMRSLGNLSNLKNNFSSTSLATQRNFGGDVPDFNPEEMKKQRMQYEANWAKGTVSSRS